MLQLKNNLTVGDFKGYTVIVPSICIGNAAQLAVDLLISSKELKRVGTMHHPALIPCHGPSAFQHAQENSAACEIYSCPISKLLVFQFRSPFISRHATSFHNELATILKDASIVIILSASLGFEKRIIDSCPYEYKASDSFKEIHGEQLKGMKWKEFEGETIFGGGNALQLYKVLEEEQNVPVMILFRYLLEGDNSTDAALILRELSELCEGFLGLKTGDGIQLKLPISWKLLFGNDIPELIF